LLDEQVRDAFSVRPQLRRRRIERAIDRCEVNRIPAH
jgi:hypothetical protein